MYSATDWKDDLKRLKIFSMQDRNILLNGEVDIHVRITGFLNFMYCPVFQKLESTAFQKLDVFQSSGELFLRDATE